METFLGELGQRTLRLQKLQRAFFRLNVLRARRDYKQFRPCWYYNFDNACIYLIPKFRAVLFLLSVEFARLMFVLCPKVHPMKNGNLHFDQ